MGNVPVPRWLLVLVGASLAVSLLAVAFLLGRVSAARQEAAWGGPAAAPAGGLPPPGERPAPVREPREGQATGGVAGEVASGGAASPGETPVPPEAGSPGLAAAARVGAYLDRLGAIRAQAQGGSSEEVAQRLLGALLQGDPAAFDGLLGEVERAEREVQGVLPPPECASYHESLLAVMAESRRLLAELKAGIVAEDSTRLLALAGRAASIQQRAERLQDLEKDLRRRHGL